MGFKRKNLISLVFALVLLPHFNNAINDAITDAIIARPETTITECGKTISIRGNYEVANDLKLKNSHGRCITIESDNVVLDCKNYRISDEGTNEGVGISISKPLPEGKIVPQPKNIVVKNCVIEKMFEAIETTGSNIRIQDNELNGNYYGIIAGPSDPRILSENIVLESNTISQNSLEGTEGHGHPILIQRTKNAVLEKNVVCDNIQVPVYYGSPVYCDENSQVVDGGRNLIASEGRAPLNVSYYTNCPIKPLNCDTSPRVFKPTAKAPQEESLLSQMSLVIIALGVAIIFGFAFLKLQKRKS